MQQTPLEEKISRLFSGLVTAQAKDRHHLQVLSGAGLLDKTTAPQDDIIFYGDGKAQPSRAALFVLASTAPKTRLSIQADCGFEPLQIGHADMIKECGALYTDKARWTMVNAHGDRPAHVLARIGALPDDLEVSAYLMRGAWGAGPKAIELMMDYVEDTFEEPEGLAQALVGKANARSAARRLQNILLTFGVKETLTGDAGQIDRLRADLGLDRTNQGNAISRAYTKWQRRRDEKRRQAKDQVMPDLPSTQPGEAAYEGQYLRQN